MKKINHLIIPLAAVLSMASCTKGFEEKNQNPYAIQTLDAAFLFTNAERQMASGQGLENEQTVVQQFVNAYTLGATSAFNQNEDTDGFNRGRWDGIFGNVVKPLVQILELTKDDPAKANLYNMARIWKAYAFMVLVDTYGDVPYTEAGQAFLKGINFPKYDKDEVIYEDLYKELKTATAALSATGGYVKEDLFFGPAGNADAQSKQWKKVGYSLMLRLGMRYSKIDATKAASIAQEAFAGGVMQSNNDNVKITQYNNNYNNPINVNIRQVNPYFYYMAEPFITFLKGQNDPRLKYFSANYANPNVYTTTPDTVSANQFGFPVGYDQTTVGTAPGYRGTKGGGQNYSQINYTVVGSATAPTFLITNAQTQLLLAEAKFRGWITSGPTAKDFYEAGVNSAMDEWSLYPGVLSPAITVAEKSTYLRQPGVVWDDANALKVINNQYWVANFGVGSESWANFRRSGFPMLTPNNFNNKLNGGFVRRFSYPNDEVSLNTANYNAAVASLGGPDNLTTRIFWDKQ